MSFGDYVRSAREKRSLTLEELAARTKIKRHLLADLEEDDLARWPKYLIYRYGYLRSIADALGLNRDQVLDRFDEAFPEYFPVAFDGGKRSLKSRSSRARETFLTPGGIALAVMLGLAAGLVLSVAFKRSPGVASVAEAEPVIAYAGQDITLEPEAPDAAPAVASSFDVEGEVRVVSNPPNAVVTVNGIGRGRTPARIRYLPLGSYTIRVIQFGYKARESRVTLTPDEPVRRVRIALRAKS